MGREREALAEARPTGVRSSRGEPGSATWGIPSQTWRAIPGDPLGQLRLLLQPLPLFPPLQKSIPRRSFPVVPGDEGARISVFLTAEVPEVSPNFFYPQGSCCVARGVKGGRKRELGKGPRGNVSSPCVSRDHLETLGSLPPHTISPFIPPTPAFLLD